MSKTKLLYLVLLIHVIANSISIASFKNYGFQNIYRDYPWFPPLFVAYTIAAFVAYFKLTKTERK